MRGRLRVRYALLGMVFSAGGGCAGGLLLQQTDRLDLAVYAWLATFLVGLSYASAVVEHGG